MVNTAASSSSYYRQKLKEAAVRGFDSPYPNNIAWNFVYMCAHQMNRLLTIHRFPPPHFGYSVKHVKVNTAAFGRANRCTKQQLAGSTPRVQICRY